MESLPEAPSSDLKTSSDAKKRLFRKCRFSYRKTTTFEGRVVLKPPPRAIWTGLRSCYPWETPLPHSTKNKKQIVFLFSSIFCLFSALFPLPSKPAEVPRGGGMAEKRVGPPLAASFGDLWRPLLGSLFSSFLSLRSSLFSLLSSLFSLSSWSCEASIP